MKRAKGCLNSACTEYKKTYYKKSDEYCDKCGTKLNYVCQHPNCFKLIPDDTNEKFCPVHIAERQDKKQQLKESLEKIGSRILAAGVLAISVSKAAIDIVRKK